MKDHSNTRKKFIQLSRAWYGEACLKDLNAVDEIMVGLYDEGGGTSGEFGIRWYKLGHHEEPTPRIEIFNDAWEVAFVYFADFLKELSHYDSIDITPEQVYDILKSHGVEDATNTG